MSVRSDISKYNLWSIISYPIGGGGAPVNTKYNVYMKHRDTLFDNVAWLFKSKHVYISAN